MHPSPPPAFLEEVWKSTPSGTGMHLLIGMGMFLWERQREDKSLPSFQPLP